MIFDSHAHYDDKQFEKDRDELLSSMGENNVTKIVNVGASIESSKRTMKLAETYEFVYAAIGVHPSDISCLNEEAMVWLKQAAAREKNTAAGENGTPGSYLAVSLGRQGIAILALALILLLRNQMPWPFTSVIIGAAIGLTGVSVVLSYRVAKQFEE